jgi:hypothetical protein
MHFTTVLVISYGEDLLLKSFFSEMLGIADTRIHDVSRELCARSDGEQALTSVAVAREIYGFLDTNTSSDEDWERLRYVPIFLSFEYTAISVYPETRTTLEKTG